MNYNRSELFIIRRCIWSGRTTRADLMLGFPSSTATATRALDYAATRWPTILQRKPKWLEALPHPEIPARIRLQVDARCMMRLIQEDPARFDLIGLTMDELHVVSSHLKQDVILTMDGGLLEVILRATIRNAHLDIRYVGLRIGEMARWRSVTPVALNYFQGQWRLSAHDLEATGYPLKSFVLPRILDAQISTDKQPKGLRLQTGDVAVRMYSIKLNPRMTDDQKTAIARELGINDQGVISLSDDAVFDFKKTYMDSDLDQGSGQSPSIVWPLVVNLQRLG